jgi:hypothetical protein
MAVGNRHFCFRKLIYHREKSFEDNPMINVHKQIQIAIRYSDIDGARRMLDEALAKQPDAELYYLASLLADTFEERRAYLEQSLSLNPRHIKADSEFRQLQRRRYFEKRKLKSINRKRLLSLLFCIALLLTVLGFYLKQRYIPPVLPADLAGEWVGSSYSPSPAVGTIRHELNIRQEGGELVGTSSGHNIVGRADAYIRGSYENGYISYETYGGSHSGWDWVCHIAVTLEYKEIDGVPHLIGTYYTLPSEDQEWDCSFQGTIDFVRPD